MTENRTPGFRRGEASCAGAACVLQDQPGGTAAAANLVFRPDRSRAGQGQERPRRQSRRPMPNSRYDAGVRPASGEKIRAERCVRTRATEGAERAPRGAPRAAAGRKTQPAQPQREIRRDSAPQRREPITVQQRRTQGRAPPRAGDARARRPASRAERIDPNQQHDQEYGFSGQSGRAASASAA